MNAKQASVLLDEKFESAVKGLNTPGIDSTALEDAMQIIAAVITIKLGSKQKSYLDEFLVLNNVSRAVFKPPRIAADLSDDDLDDLIFGIIANLFDKKIPFEPASRFGYVFSLFRFALIDSKPQYQDANKKRHYMQLESTTTLEDEEPDWELGVKVERPQLTDEAVNVREVKSALAAGLADVLMREPALFVAWRLHLEGGEWQDIAASLNVEADTLRAWRKRWGLGGLSRTTDSSFWTTVIGTWMRTAGVDSQDMTLFLIAFGFLEEIALSMEPDKKSVSEI